MKSKPKFIIIHGIGGHPNGNWFPWLKQELEVLGYEAMIPAFPTPEGQSLQSWKDTFYRQVGTTEPNMMMIGHSLGAGFILNLLETSLQPVLATYLVCGFIGKLGLPDFDPLNQSFVCHDFNWERIRRNLGHCCLLNSDNDPYVPLAKAEELSEKLRVPVTVVPNSGHINEESGYTSFPLILDELKSFLSRQTTT